MNPNNITAIHSEPPARQDLGHQRDKGLRPPPVSIVVTSYNYSTYLPACLHSIALQSHTDFECVVVDDASTDNSVEVIEAFIAEQGDPQRYRLIRHDENRGQMAGFRTGLAHTSKPFVVFVDADDVLFGDFLDTHLKAHLNGSCTAAFSSSDQLQIGPEGEIIASTCPALQRTPGRAVPAGGGKLPELLSWTLDSEQGMALSQAAGSLLYLPIMTGDEGMWPWSTTSAMMFRRSALELILSPECERFRICADYYLCRFSHALGGSLIMPTIHGGYRRHGRNGFGLDTIIGGDQPLNDINKHPPIGEFNLCFVEHVVAHRKRFVGLFPERHICRMIARFAPRNYCLDLLRTPSSLHPMRRKSLLRERIAWTVIRYRKRIRTRVGVILRRFKAENNLV